MSRLIRLECRRAAAHPAAVRFEVLSEITGITTIARGSGIRERRRLSKRYGRARWLKRKGFAEVKLANGAIVFAELHWYEAHGIGKREMIKRIQSDSLYG